MRRTTGVGTSRRQLRGRFVLLYCCFTAALPTAARSRTASCSSLYISLRTYVSSSYYTRLYICVRGRARPVAALALYRCTYIYMELYTYVAEYICVLRMLLACIYMRAPHAYICVLRVLLGETGSRTSNCINMRPRHASRLEASRRQQRGRARPVARPARGPREQPLSQPQRSAPQSADEREN